MRNACKIGDDADAKPLNLHNNDRNFLQMAAAMSVVAENESALQTDELFATTPWCFDLLLYYRSNEDDEQSRHVLAQLETYTRFSYVFNGVMTTILAVCGLLGNAMFAYQVARARANSQFATCFCSMCAYFLDSTLTLFFPSTCLPFVYALLLGLGTSHFLPPNLWPRFASTYVFYNLIIELGKKLVNISWQFF